MSTSEASSSMKQLVEKVKKTKSRSSGSKKASRSSGSKKASKSSGSKKARKSSSSSSEQSESGEPFYMTIVNKFNSNRMLWGGVALALMVVIWYYLKNKKNLKNKEEEDVNLLNDLKKDEPLNKDTDNKVSVDEEIRKAFMERDDHDRKNNIVRLKLPEKYMTDDDGRPVILTPEVIENIQRHANEQSRQQQKNSKKKKQKIETSDEEPDNIKSQDLSNTEMDEIREQLDMMDSTNSIMPSNN